MFQNNVDYVYSSMSSVSFCTLLIVQTLIVLKILTGYGPRNALDRDGRFETSCDSSVNRTELCNMVGAVYDGTQERRSVEYRERHRSCPRGEY